MKAVVKALQPLPIKESKLCLESHPLKRKLFRFKRWFDAVIKPFFGSPAKMETIGEDGSARTAIEPLLQLRPGIGNAKSG